MDILHRKFHKIGDSIYFLRSTIERPFIYLRFFGKIRNIVIDGEQIWYQIEILEVLETYQTVRKFLERVRYRVRHANVHKFIDKFFYSFDLTEYNYSKELAKKYQKYWMDLPAMLCFESIEELNQEMQKINLRLANQLTEMQLELQSRITR